MEPKEFDAIVEEAYSAIPARFRRRLRNVAIVIEPEPPRGCSLLGLYQGRPLAQRSVFENFTLPDRITIFQGPHERMARTREQLRRMVAETVWHEVAHYFGLNEREVRAAERRRAR